MCPITEPVSMTLTQFYVNYCKDLAEQVRLKNDPTMLYYDFVKMDEEDKTLHYFVYDEDLNMIDLDDLLYKSDAEFRELYKQFPKAEKRRQEYLATVNRYDGAEAVFFYNNQDKKAVDKYRVETEEVVALRDGLNEIDQMF